MQMAGKLEPVPGGRGVPRATARISMLECFRETCERLYRKKHDQ